MIMIKKFSSKTMFVIIERNFLKENDITSAKQFLFDFITNRDVKGVLIMFIKIKNVNNCSIYSFSYNFNKKKFINVIFEMLKMKFINSK